MPLSASGERPLSDRRHNYFPCNLENILVKAALSIQDPAPLNCSSLCLLHTFNSHEPNLQAEQVILFLQHLFEGQLLPVPLVNSDLLPL